MEEWLGVLYSVMVTVLTVGIAWGVVKGQIASSEKDRARLWQEIHDLRRRVDHLTERGQK